MQGEFTEFMVKFGQQLSYHATPEQINVSTVAPTETMNDAFLLTYRFFLQANEPICFINPNQEISPRLTDPSLSPQWREEVQDVAQKIHAYLREEPHFMPIQVNLCDQQGNIRTENLTRWDILETILYGDAAHSSKRKRLNSWLSTPFAPLVEAFLMGEFRAILVCTLDGIQHLADCARIELDLPQNR